MVDYPSLNILAILVAVVINNIIGFLWYSDKYSIGQYWMKEMGKTSEDLEPNMLYFGANTLLSLFTVWGIAMVVAYSGASSFLDGILIGGMAWLAFVVTTHFAAVAFEDRKLRIYEIYIGYQLVVFLISGVILALWD